LVKLNYHKTVFLNIFQTISSPNRFLDKAHFSNKTFSNMDPGLISYHLKKKKKIIIIIIIIKFKNFKRSGGLYILTKACVTPTTTMGKWNPPHTYLLFYDLKLDD
jgi:hypothetical protein